MERAERNVPVVDRSPTRSSNSLGLRPLVGISMAKVSNRTGRSPLNPNTATRLRPGAIRPRRAPPRSRQDRPAPKRRPPRPREPASEAQGCGLDSGGVWRRRLRANRRSDTVTERAKAGMVRVAAPLLEIGRLAATEGERWSHAVEGRRHHEPALQRRGRFVAHPLWVHRMAGPEHHDALGLGQAHPPDGCLSTFESIRRWKVTKPWRGIPPA